MNVDDSIRKPEGQTDLLLRGSSSPINEDLDGVPAQYGYVDIVQFFRILLSNLWVILIVTVAGSAITFLVVNSLQEVYQSEASLVVLPNFDSSAIPKPLEKIEIAQGTYVQVLRSQSLRNDVRQTLASRYTSSQLSKIVTGVQPVENSSIIVVTVQSENAQLAQDYANEVVKQITTKNPLPAFEVAYGMEILDEASFPSSPSYPDKKLSLALGGLGSFILGILGAFLMDTYIKARRRAKLLVSSHAV